MSDENEVLDTQDEVMEAQEPIEPVEKSMDDTIRETLEAIEARGEEENKSDRVRDEKGRFAKGSNAESEIKPNPTAPAQETPVAETVEPEIVPPTVPPELQRLGLRKDEAEAIAANPVALQAFMRRSEEMHKGLEQYRAKAQFADQMIQTLQPYQQQMQQRGQHPAQVVSSLMQADTVLRYGSQDQKQAAAMQLLRDYGIQFDPNTATPYIDQNYSNLQQQLQQMQGWILQRNQEQQAREAAELNSQIAKFSSDPANKHFETVRNDMAGLLQAGIATDLKDAYERAIYANPQVRALILAEQQAQEAEKRKAEAAQKAQEAKKASVVNIPRKGTFTPKKQIGTMDDTIREAAQRLGIL